LQVVADVHRRHQEADVLGDLLADARMRLQQFAVLGAVDQRHQAVADFQAEAVDRGDVVPADLFALRLGLGGGTRWPPAAACARLRSAG
jgi:hypothetical protein